MDEWRNERWLREKYWDRELSLKQIGELVGVTATTIQREMKELGIERRTPKTERLPKISHTSQGYEMLQNNHEGEHYRCLHHRLIAVSEYGFQEVCNSIIHHKNGIPWDNRIENLETLPSRGEHREKHLDTHANKKTPWRNKNVLRRLYVEEELTGEQIAERMDWSHGTVYNWLREFDFID